MTDCIRSFVALTLLVALASGCATAEQLARDAMQTTGTSGDGSGAPRAADWQTLANAGTYQNATVGAQYRFSCPANPGRSRVAGPVIGSGPYTLNSPVCASAVHAGAITFQQGGVVTIEMVRTVSLYQGSERNGVQSTETSFSQGYDRAYRVVR